MQGRSKSPDLREWARGHNRGRRGWDRLREQPWNIPITRCERDSQAKPLYNRGVQPVGLRWPGGGGAGRGITIMVMLIADSSYTRKKPTQHCKAITFQLKENLKNYTRKGTFYWMALLCGIPLYFNTIYSITSNCMVKDRLLSSNQIKDDLIQCIFTSSQCWGWMYVLVLKLPTILRRNKYNFVAEEHTNTKHSMTFHY